MIRQIDLKSQWTREDTNKQKKTKNGNIYARNVNINIKMKEMNEQKPWEMEREICNKWNL